MSPEQFLIRIAKQQPAAVYLFLGPEGYQRRICKDALIDKVLPGNARSDGLTQIDLEDTSLAQVIDDACSLSLFSCDRVIGGRGAETALPRRWAWAEDDEEGGTKAGPADLLKAYLKAPTPGTVLVFGCNRFD